MNQPSGLSEFEFLDPEHNNWKLENDIHIWKFPAIQPVFSFLTPDENEFAARFRFDADKNRFSTGRHALRLLLSKYLLVNPEEIIFNSGGGQKPAIKFPSSKIKFNLSHSGEWVMLAFASEELGIDIEKINPAFFYTDLLPEHFSKAEREMIYADADPVSRFYYLWTRKEALTKAWGTGLQENMQRLEVLEKNHEFEMNQTCWKLESFQISHEYPAAVAYSSNTRNILFFDGTEIG